MICAGNDVNPDMLRNGQIRKQFVCVAVEAILCISPRGVQQAGMINPFEHIANNPPWMVLMNEPSNLFGQGATSPSVEEHCGEDACFFGKPFEEKVRQ